MGLSFPVPVSMIEVGSYPSDVTNTVLAIGSSFDFPIVPIPTWVYHKVERAFIQLSIPYVFNAHGADNWFTSFIVTISPDDGAHSYTAIADPGTCFRCQNGATSSFVQWIGSVDIGAYIDDAIEYGASMALDPHFHVTVSATAHGDSIAFMLHSSVVKIFLRG